MEKIEFGMGISMPIKPSTLEKAERFVSEVLGCKEIMRNKHYTCFKFPNGQVLGLTPDDNAPSEIEYENSTWLEIVSDDFESTMRRIRDFGVRKVDGGMEGAFFFNLPGGAVLRLVSQEQAKKMAQEI